MTASGRNGFEAYLLLLIAGWSLVNWIGGVEGETITLLFTEVGKHVWFAGLIISSVLALVGIATGTYTGLLLERASLFLLAGFFGWIGLAFLGFAFKINALHLVYVTPMLLLAATVALSRTRQIRCDLIRMRTQVLLKPPTETT